MSSSYIIIIIYSKVLNHSQIAYGIIKVAFPLEGKLHLYYTNGYKISIIAPIVTTSPKDPTKDTWTLFPSTYILVILYLLIGTNLLISPNKIIPFESAGLISHKR